MRTLLALLLSSSICFAEYPASFHDAYRDCSTARSATCRLYEGGSPHSTLRGHGVAFLDDGVLIHVATAGHVWSGPLYAQWHYDTPRGRRATECVPLDVLFVEFDQLSAHDFAILTVKKSSLPKDAVIATIPFASQAERPDRGEWLATPRFGSLSYSQVEKADAWLLMMATRFQHGTSGSPVVNMGATKIYGIVSRVDGQCTAHFQIVDIMRKIKGYDYGEVIAKAAP